LPSDACILGFDTSAAHSAAALLCGERIAALRDEEMGTGQAERLMPLLAAVLAEAGQKWRDLDAIAVGIGPGNFTGIRIAVSAARGLALSTGAPAIGVSRFDALAFGLHRPVLALVAAPRGQSYAHVVGTDAAPRLVTAGSLPGDLAGSGMDCVGHDAEAFARATGGQALCPALPLAQAIARIAATRLGDDNPRPAPLYIRAADAAPASDPPPVILT